jgi:hypothetical protein
MLKVPGQIKKSMKLLMEKAKSKVESIIEV